MKRKAKIQMIFLFLLLAVVFLLFISLFSVHNVYAEDVSDDTIFSKELLDLICQPELNDAQVLGIKKSIQKKWGSSYNFTNPERWTAIMSMADDQRKVEILLLLLEIDSKIREERILKAVNSQDGKIADVQNLIAGYHAWVKSFVENYSDALLKAKNDEIVRKDSLLTEMSKKLKEAFEKIEELEKQLAEMPAAKSGVDQAEYDRLKADYERQIVELKELKATIEELKKELAKKPEPGAVWPEEKPKPKYFWLGGGLIFGTEEYPNVYGKLIDSMFEDPAYIGYFGEFGARYVYKKYLAGEGYLGISRDKDIYGGACVKFCYDVLNLGGGFMVLPDINGKTIVEPTVNASFETASSRLGLNIVIIPRQEKAYVSLRGKVSF